MNKRSLAPEIFLIALASLLLEISYTRVFSFKVSSYFTYLIIGFSMLGIGTGGVFVALVPWLRRASLSLLFPVVACAGAIATGAGYFVVAGVELSTYRDPTGVAHVARLALVCTALFSTFAAVGLLLAAAFARAPERIHRLYFADLVGAGLGCALAVPFMVALSPPGCVFASAAALALAGVRPAPGAAGRASAGLLAAVLALGAIFPASLPEIVVDPTKTMSAENMKAWGLTRSFSRWSPVFRVDVLDSALATDGGKWLAHDGLMGSGLRPFDGDVSSVVEHYRGTDRALPFALAKEQPQVLIIGAAGGNEILASLSFGAESVTGVELNPVTVSLLREHYADFTGHLPERDNVTLVNGEARSFLEHADDSFDLIYFVAPDSYASMNAAQASGFVLVESYLYTVEMLLEAVSHLNPGGVIAMQFGEVDYVHKPRRTARYLATAREAFAELGVHDLSRHVMLATTADYPFQLTTVLLSPDPFSEARRDAFLEVAERLPRTTARFAWDRVEAPGIPGQVIALPGDRLPALYASYEYDVTPVSDDAPFFWHFVRFRDVLTGDPIVRNTVVTEDGRGEVALVVMLGVSLAFSAIFLVAPFALVRKRWTRLPTRGRASLYFAALGTGFMFYEICLIQKLTLFLGYPTYSLTVTLFGLLVFSGIGSLATGAYVERRDTALVALAAALLALTVFYLIGLDRLVDALLGAPLGLRVAVALAAVAPLGLCLGAFMPLGLATVARSTPHGDEYVAWGWAINGAFSVTGSILATIVSMSLGFRVLLLLAAALYLVAVLALRAFPLRPLAAPAE